MKTYGIAIGVNFNARNQKQAEQLAELLVEAIKCATDDNGEFVDSAELSGQVEELE